ncbi:flagellar motor protein MotB [Meridianimarinicoccus aquatilis]|uniref:Chemotaxis protein MotB n=1 Tax=Meridianimarinicoccus aquatilis TaxID=2552766 RepID=A0A4R6B5E8_9RHOB|nr:flagellar motor protein MotB [Fluviibacterium aquatile]QIE40579.1 OmpA family protein [Rhodobacteraceae bacterium SC52]TDL91086.1 chemotaxis protein MotB [Fluviibacterium aquatile]
MKDKNALAPIIIKRKKVIAADGHHGGAWKVAYADFVTAMMAFFLLMWLLNATTEKQRKGLADYFSPVIPVNRISGGGEGSFWGDSVFAEDVLAQNGTGATMLHSAESAQARGDAGEVGAQRAEENEKKAVQDLMRVMAARSGESMAQLENMPHVITRVSDTGMVIDIFELPEGRLFDPVTGKITRRLEDTLRLIVSAADMVTNQISVEAHVPARPLVVASNPVWDVSTQRAQMVQTKLDQIGFAPDRLLRITGYADRRPADPGTPMSLRNSRVVVTILRDDV